jgi:hypothetical protein
MFVTWSFLERTVTVMNKSHQQRRKCIFYVSSEWCTAIRIIFLNSSLYLQEDTSPWNWRIRTAQVSSCFHICFYLQTVRISVFTVFCPFAQSRNAPFCFCCVLFWLFQVPLTSCASPWRAGVTRNGASPKYCYHYVLDPHCYNSRIVYLNFPTSIILQSVRGYSTIVLTVTINGLQEIHPVIYLLYSVRSQVTDIWLLIDEVSKSHTATYHSR